MENIIILGTGCAGLTAAIYTARAGLNPLVLDGTQPGGQLTTTTDVENFPGFPDGVDGFSLTYNMRNQAAKFGAKYKEGVVVSSDFSSEDKKTLTLQTGEVLEAKCIIIATGASPRLTGVKGEKELYGGKGVSVCATCDGAFFKNVPVTVVGGGDSACEEALFLTRFASKVNLIHRRDTLRASKAMADRVLANEKISIHWDSLPEEIIASEDGTCGFIDIKNLKTQQTTKLDTNAVFISIGHIPNTNAFSSSLKLREDKTIDADDVKTSVKGVFVAGDCTDNIYRQAINAAGAGCRAGMQAVWYLES